MSADEGRSSTTSADGSVRPATLRRAFGTVTALVPPFDLPTAPTYAGVEAAAVTITVTEQPPEADWTRSHERYATAPVGDDAGSVFRFLELPDRYVVRVGRNADVHVLDDRMDYHLKVPRHRYLAEIVLGGLGFAMWLERRDQLTLHGSATAFDGAGVGFLATKGTGKSSLAAYLTAHDDPLITEDLLVITMGSDAGDAVTVQPGLAQLRLWPEQAAKYVAGWESLDQPHPAFSKRRVPVGGDGLGRLADGPVPLRRLYILQRTDDRSYQPTLVDVSGVEAVRLLLSHSYLSEVGEGFGWQRRRLAQLGRLLAASPVKLLRYPSGDGGLAKVRTAIREDLARSTS